MTTPLYRLLDQELDGRLHATVKNWRREGRSWRWISAEIGDVTGETVSHHTLVLWFPELRRPVHELLRARS